MDSESPKHNKLLSAWQIKEIKSIKPDFFLDKDSPDLEEDDDYIPNAFIFNPPQNIEIIFISSTIGFHISIPEVIYDDDKKQVSVTNIFLLNTNFKPGYVSFKTACVLFHADTIDVHLVHSIRNENPLVRCLGLLDNGMDSSMLIESQKKLDGYINLGNIELDLFFQIKAYLKLLASQAYKNHLESVVIKQVQKHKDLIKKNTKAVVLVTNKNTILNQQKKEIEKQKEELEKEMKKSSIHYIKLQKSLLINQQQQEQLQKAIDDMAILNAQLRQQNEEVISQREEIENQQYEIEAQRDNAILQFKKIMDQQTEINESLEYASRIQQAILPPESFIKVLLPESFILNLPKSIVSGDFYFITQNRSKTVIVLGDATGHGISGALMTMLGIAYLNEIVNKDILTSASDILDKLRAQVIRSLHQTGAFFEANDGFDMSICLFDIETYELQFAGANLPAYIVRENELLELVPDKMPVGIYDLHNDSFHTYSMILQNHDMIYMFSDGFADQFGGPDESKFKYKRFRDLLKSQSTLAASLQGLALKNEFYQWKGQNEQIDDILVIGFRIQ